MLYPRSNDQRQVIDLSGFWEFRFDPEDQGRRLGWHQKLQGGQPIAVPASWNDQFVSMRDYLGPAWYETQFDLPWGWGQQAIRLRFGSVNYLASVWLNGIYLGCHEGGHLPFEFDVSPSVIPTGNRLIVQVDGHLAPDRVPPGKVPLNRQDSFEDSRFPDTNFDFFPFCGIHRPVQLYTVPRGGLNDVNVNTVLQGSLAFLDVKFERLDDNAASARLTLDGHQDPITCEVAVTDRLGAATLRIPDPALWGPGHPNLYTLTIELCRGTDTIDKYSLPVGLRTISVEGDGLFLNGKPVTLLGFGRHEDFPVAGRGLVPFVIIKDYALMEWTGANSFRTTHYPYSDEMMALADRLGYLVIDETPAVGLFFQEEGIRRRLELCCQYIRELISRDKNHPSVVIWSIANEPHSTRESAKAFLRELYDQARELDPFRPITMASYLGNDEEALEFCDLICLNRYYGWYTCPGDLSAAAIRLSDELDRLHERYHKPIVLTEFGADSIAGWHAEPPEMFSEEYQAEVLKTYNRVLQGKPFVVGQHVWNLCDFKSVQSVRRTGGMNLKGVFTRDRRPKLAAHQLRQQWCSK